MVNKTSIAILNDLEQYINDAFDLSEKFPEVKATILEELDDFVSDIEEVISNARKRIEV